LSERKQPFGTRAREFTGEFAFGKLVTVEIKGTDRYRRIIGRVVLDDGRVLNEELLKAGMAWVYVKYCPDERYYEFEAQARKRNVGLWRDADPVRRGSSGPTESKLRSEDVRRTQHLKLWHA
jgi:endonuclease YncB( thermonuclease family)